MSKRDFFNGCLPGNWVEADMNKNIINKQEQRKDVATLLAELEEIKNHFEKLEEKKIRLQNLMRFYKGDLATE